MSDITKKYILVSGDLHGVAPCQSAPFGHMLQKYLCNFTVKGILTNSMGRVGTQTEKEGRSGLGVVAWPQGGSKHQSLLLLESWKQPIQYSKSWGLVPQAKNRWPADPSVSPFGWVHTTPETHTLGFCQGKAGIFSYSLTNREKVLSKAIWSAIRKGEWQMSAWASPTPLHPWCCV